MSANLTSLRVPHDRLDPMAALKEPIAILLGVSEGQQPHLAAIGLETVFDLATSTLFANAEAICSFADTGEGRFAAVGRIPRDILREGDNIPVFELPLQPVSHLASPAPKTRLKALAKAIDAETIRDLAGWPPYRASRMLLDRAYNPLEDVGADDPEAPADLIPGNAQYPTERLQYELLVFDRFVTPPPRITAKIDSRTPTDLSDPIDIAALATDEAGYRHAAIGGVLTYTQSWYTKGLALGNLIHAVALGPGESTKIAMIDWTRRTRAAVSDVIEEGESLRSDVARARAITEITQAVARETQEGRSAAWNLAQAEEMGGAGPGSSFGGSRAASIATAWSTSSGQREISASLAQNIVDRTHQASHVARSRRASLVREVSQSESESITTRTVTNYNHMHALTIQYYETVQLYRTVVQLTAADRCVFLPMRLVDFSNPRVVERYRTAIAGAALTDDVRALRVADHARFALWAPLRTGSWDAAKVAAMNQILGGVGIGAPTDDVLSLPAGFQLSDIYFPPDTPFSALVVTLASGEQVRLPLSVEEGEAGGPMFGTLHVSPSFRRDARRVLEERVSEVRRVEAERSGEVSTESSATVNLFSLDWEGMPLAHLLTWQIGMPAGLAKVPLFDLQLTPTTAELSQHLNEHRLYYSQVIWRSLDAATVGMLVSKHQWSIGDKVRPLVEVVDPTPVAVVANYLVLRLSGDDAEERRAWLAQKNIILGTKREDLIPVPSGGVFAEAVLGRFNSAEKLDLTRFWNWQDSPIPVTAPEIAAISAGSRSEPDNTVPSQLGAPVLNIVNPPAMPDPQGLTAILAAIQSGSMFRDMSGLTGIIDLAQAALAEAQQGAGRAAGQAGQNLAAAAQLGAKILEVAAKGAAGYLTGGTSLAAGVSLEGLAGLAGGISGQGAKVNYGRQMDQRQLRNGQSGNGASPAAGSSTTQALRGSGTVPSNELTAFRTAALGLSANAGTTAILGGADDYGGPSVQLASAPLANHVRQWDDLLRFAPPQQIVNDLAVRDMRIQRFEEALGPNISLDYYPILVTELPSVNGQRLTSGELMREIRMGIAGTTSLFVDSSLTTFEPYDPDDNTRWSSANPIGSVLFLRIWGPDNAAVVVTAFQDQSWIFSTVTTPRSGQHPVSGHREFAFVDTTSGNSIFYTRGADRSSGFLESQAVVDEYVTYAMADRLWLSFQHKVAAWINANGGRAEVPLRDSDRYRWSFVRGLLKLPASL